MKLNEYMGVINCLNRLLQNKMISQTEYNKACIIADEKYKKVY